MTRILFVLHEASRTGAPFTQLHLMRWLKSNTNYEMMLILLYGGDLVAEFQKISEVYIVNKPYVPAGIGKRVYNKVSKLFKSDDELLKELIIKFNPQIIFANTAAILSYAVKLKYKSDIKIISYLHELEITFYHISKEDFALAAAQVDSFIMGSKTVKHYYENVFLISLDKTHLVYDFIGEQSLITSHKFDIRERYGVTQQQKIVGGMASLIWRKGPELFIEVARRVLKTNPETHFIWVGGKTNSPTYLELKRDVRLLGLNERIIFAGEQVDIQEFYHAFDIFLLTSREDPFPLVCLEAALAYTPVVCFAEAGGMPEFVRDDAGSIVSYLDLDSMAERVCELLNNESLRVKKASVGHERALQHHTIEVAGPDIVKLLDALVA
jgi:glycosyltransferase involved in cell wall biosynthesis